jgi:hypothetical protein
MEDALRIFISHKMPTDSDLAQQIGSRLALYGGNQIKVTHAGKFRYGENWRSRIQQELDQAHWLIYLYTDPDEDWGFCLFECGYFNRTMESDKRKRLITFCRSQSQINGALEEFNAAVISEDTVVKLLKDIYSKDGWNVSPDLEASALKATAKEIVTAFSGSERREANFDVATSVTMELVLSDLAKADLKNNRVPSDVTVSGTKDWQRLFGRDLDTGGWQWRDLITDWPYADIYEFLIAKMISEALEAQMPEGILLREPESHKLNRMTLRRYERIAGTKYRFHFTVAPFRLPFDVPIEAGQKAKQTVLYHLVNLSWYFRQRIVDQLYNRLLEVLSMSDPDRATVKALYDAIGSELMQISAQAVIRGLDNFRVLERALDPSDPETPALLNRLKTWRELRERIFAAMAEGVTGLPSVARDLYTMAVQNYDVYRKVALNYARVAQELEYPQEPPTDVSFIIPQRQNGNGAPMTVP